MQDNRSSQLRTVFCHTASAREKGGSTKTHFCDTSSGGLTACANVNCARNAHRFLDQYQLDRSA